MATLIDSALLGPLGTVVGLVMAALLVAATVGLLNRLYFHRRAPLGLAMLFSLSVVALYLNVKSALGQVISGTSDPLAMEAVLYNGGTLLAAALVVPIGVRLGDRVARATSLAGEAVAERDLGRIVRSAGRVTTIELPEEIVAVPGYEPVAETVRESLAGETFVFPRGLTVGALTERIETRIREDYGVGYVDAEITADGSVEHLGVGGRKAGIGPTLGPGSAAVAIRADPGYAAGPGDAVQLWADEDSGPIARGEIRGTAGDVVTVALDATEAPAIAGGQYRLVTLPASLRPEHEFSRILRAADESMAAITVGDQCGLVGMPIGALTPTILAVKPQGGSVIVVPSHRHVLAVGDVIYAVATPTALRRLEIAAGDVPEGS